MYLRAGIVSLLLLLASRVLGLARESVQAYSFGATGLADLAVVMLTLPDIASALLAGGALSYALLPWWARQVPHELARSQRRASLIFLAAGVALAALCMGLPLQAGALLAPGVGDGLRDAVAQAMRWGALGIPPALLTLVWYTRLQHERDVVGMYGMNVVHTGIVIVAMVTTGLLHAQGPAMMVAVLGAGLLLAFSARALFLWTRLRRVVEPERLPEAPVQGLPAWRIWAWALLATAAPVALPLLARSLVSRGGEGALATFNYAWKLVELPNQLAIQVVAMLAFPAFARAHAEGREFTVQLRAAFMLAWTLACAAAVGLWLAAPALSRLLFGWGKMEPQQVAEIANWAAVGALTLLPQALVAVLTLVLATTQRLPLAAAGYLLALAVVATASPHDGPAMMLVLAAGLLLAAAVLGWGARAHVARALPAREMAVPALLALGFGCLRPLLGDAIVVTLGGGAFAAIVIVAASYATSPTLRAALKR